MTFDEWWGKRQMAANPNFYSEEERNIARVAWLASETVAATIYTKIALDRITELEAAIVACLNQNGHLADGENCSLIDLKRAMPTWGMDCEEEL